MRQITAACCLEFNLSKMWYFVKEVPFLWVLAPIQDSKYIDSRYAVFVFKNLSIESYKLMLLIGLSNILVFNNFGSAFEPFKADVLEAEGDVTRLNLFGGIVEGRHRQLPA